MEVGSTLQQANSTLPRGRSFAEVMDLVKKEADQNHPDERAAGRLLVA